MAGWHHWLDGFESEWTPGDGDGQGGLACCDSWGHKELDMTEQLNWSLKLVKYYVIYSNHSVTRSCLILCNPTDCSTPGLPEFAKVHVHCIGDVSQTSPCLLPCSPFASNLSQHQSLFQWVGCSHQVAKVLELQRQSFQWVFKVDFLLFWLVWSPCCPRFSQESSPAPQLESIDSAALYLLYGPTLPSTHDYWKTIAVNTWNSVGNVMCLLFNILSRFVRAFLPRSKCLLISWL